MTDQSPWRLSCPSCGAPLDFQPGSTFIQCKFCKTTALLPGEQAEASHPTAGLEDIRRLAQAGKQIEAIKVFRARFGVGLKEASEAVDRLAAGLEVEARPAEAGPLTPGQVSRVLEQVQQLLRDGDKIEAIRHYREVSDVSLTKAKEVVDRVEAALTGRIPEVSIRIEGQPSFQPQITMARRRGGGILLAAVLLLVIGIALSVILFTGSSSFSLVANGPAVLLEGTGEPAVAVGMYHIDREENLVGLLDSESGKLLWRSESLPGGSYVDALVGGDGMLFSASGTTLTAYQRLDGSLAWQTTMPDRLNYDERAILYTSGRLITNNLDQSIQAYDAVSGALMWYRRIDGYDRRLRLFGDLLAVFEYLDDSYNYSLVFLDPLEGREQRLLIPTCQTDEYSSDGIDPDSGIFYDDTSGALFLVYDSSPGCIQRIDPGSRLPTWQTLVEGWFSFSGGSFPGLLTGDALYFSTEGQLLRVDLATGRARTLLMEEDYDPLPLALSGDTLLVRMRWSRGSERFELRGLDAASGDLLWKLDLGSDQPLDPPDEVVGLLSEGESIWTWHLDGEELLLLTFGAGPNELNLQTFSMLDGSLRSQDLVPLNFVSGDFYSVPEIIAWRGERLYLKLEAQVVCLDIQNGNLVYHKP